VNFQLLLDHAITSAVGDDLVFFFFRLWGGLRGFKAWPSEKMLLYDANLHLSPLSSLL
jgi:hypothetical protein